MKRKPNLIDPLTAQGASNGKLYIVGTPIGNLEDITLRAIRTLKEVDLIACEDTRRTQQLLKHYDIRTRTLSYHEHNEMTRAPELVIEMEQGASIALVTDAGMPVISDPGFRLVHLAIRHSIPVVPVPGASAFVAALAASGMPVENFRFLGFLPSKKGARRKSLQDLKSSTKTLVFYEAPHRVVETLKDARDILGDLEIVIAREVTKVHEEFLRGTISGVLERLKRGTVKGELTLLVSPPIQATCAPSAEGSIKTQLAEVIKERNIDERAGLKLVARARGISRSEAYRQLQLEKGSRE